MRSAESGDDGRDSKVVALFARHHLEIRYGILALASISSLVALDQLDALRGLNGGVRHLAEAGARLGVPGVFLVALVANASILVPLPYTLPLLAAALAGTDLPHLLLLGAASGVGAALGEFFEYTVAKRLLARKPDLCLSPVYRWVKRNVDRRPRLISLVVFTWAATPLPDDVVLVPLAMVKYRFRKLAVPLLAGKLAHTLLVVWLFHRFTHWFQPRVSASVTPDVTLGVITLFVLIVLYQVAKARASVIKRGTGSP